MGDLIHQSFSVDGSSTNPIIHEQEQRHWGPRVYDKGTRPFDVAISADADLAGQLLDYRAGFDPNDPQPEEDAKAVDFLLDRRSDYADSRPSDLVYDEASRAKLLALTFEPAQLTEMASTNDPRLSHLAETALHIDTSVIEDALGR